MAKAHFMQDPHRADPSIAAHGSKLDRVIDLLQALHDKWDAAQQGPGDPPADPPADSVTEKVFEDETHDREPFKRDVYSKN